MKSIFIVSVVVCFAMLAAAQNLSLPTNATAGEDLSVPTHGSGTATLYVFGPGTAIKRKVELGNPAQIEGSKLRQSGRYTVILLGDEHASGSFFVAPAKLEKIAFLARPSRVPAARKDVITGSAYLFDRYDNLVLEKYPVKFDLDVEGAPATTRSIDSQNGVAWVRMDSGKKAGAAQFTASSNGASVQRVVQETASEPCTIRMKAEPSKDGNILVETDPIRDCAGNPVPDGTIVTFTSTDQSGKSTVDARIKRGIAQAELPPSQKATISVAAGVVLGNEIQWSGK
ncbi:MAG: hypothetical protein ROO76_01150 [Terriglobia bacterium]|jgi:hypothetical protein|nr:hypothetical protein [Terriglobia bacterium]